MSFWSDLSKATAPTGEYANLDPATLRLTIQSLLAQQAAGGGANADPVFAQELEKAGYTGLENLQQMDITDYNYAGPNTAKVNGQPVTYAALGRGYGEYAPNDPNLPGAFSSSSSQGDTFRSQAYGIDPSGQYIVMSKPQMTPPPRATSGSFRDFLKDIAPSALIPFAGPLAGALGSAGLSAGAAAAGTGAILGGGGAALTGGDIGRGALLGGATAAIGNGLFGAAGGNALAGNDLSAFDYPTLTGAEAQAYGAPITNSVSNYGPMNTDYRQAVAGTSSNYADVIPEFDYAAGGSPDYRQPFDLEYGDGMGGPASAAMQAAGAVSPITPGLIQQLANYTGLSTGAIERLGGAAISSLAGLYGANVVGNAADRAANRLAESNQAATQLQSKMYEDQVARQQPFYQAGVNALPAYTKGVMPGGDLVRPFSLDDFLANKDPGQKYRTDMGLAAIESGAAARGLLKAGPTYQALMRAGQDYASQEYQNAYNRFGSDQATRRNALASLTGFAPTAAQQLNASGANYAANVTDLGTSTARNYANADLTGAAARQSAYGGAGGAFANALSPNPYNAFINKQMGVIG